MKLGWMRLALGASLVGATLSAQAFTLSLTGWGAAAGTGYVDLAGATPSFSTRAGAFEGKITGGPNEDPFYTYCVELDQFFSFADPLAGTYTQVAGASYFTGKPATAATITDRLGKLFTLLGGANQPGTTPDSAAIQLAVWESIYEGATFGNTDADLANPGAFASTTNSTIRTNVAAAANQLLLDAASKTSQFDVYVLKSTTNQDFLYLERKQQEIPEPASWALAGMALAGLGVARRRRA